MERLVRALHVHSASEAGCRFALASTTGRLVAALLEQPGASRTLLEAVVPYSRAATEDFLHRENVEQFCSAAAARELAVAAHRRAGRLWAQESSTMGVLADRSLVGVACTAALATLPPKRGKHRAHVAALRTGGRLGAAYWVCANVFLDRTRGRSRAEEEEIVSLMGLWVMLETAQLRDQRVEVERLLESLGVRVDSDACSSSSSSSSSSTSSTSLSSSSSSSSSTALPEEAEWDETDVARVSTSMLTPPLLRVLDGSLPSVTLVPLDAAGGDGGEEGGATPLLPPTPRPALGLTTHTSLPRHTILVSGSFNPFHGGHERMAKAARSQIRHERGLDFDPPVAFELAAVNADKPPIAVEELSARLALIVGQPIPPAISGLEPGPPPSPSSSSSSSSSTSPTSSSSSFSSKSTPSATTPLSPASRLSREEALLGGVAWPALVTRAPRFIDKARLFPGAVFVVGVDTAERLVDPRFYGDDEAAMIAALAEVRLLGCELLVAGRALRPDGSDFRTLEDLRDRIPAPFLREERSRDPVSGEERVRRPLLRPLEGFRVDISSTELRKRVSER